MEVDLEVIEIIAAVRRQSLLWDPANTRYHKLEVREQTWLQLEKELNISSNRLKRKWKYLREHFLVQLKRAHLRKGKRDHKPWKYYGYLGFLRKAVKDEYLPSGVDSESENPKANKKPRKSLESGPVLVPGSSMKIEKGKHYEIEEESWSEAEAEADKTDTTSERNEIDDDGDNDDDDNDDNDDNVDNDAVADNAEEAEDDIEFLDFDETIDESIPLSDQIDAIMKEMTAMPKPLRNLTNGESKDPTKETGKAEKEAKRIENGNCDEKATRTAKNTLPIKVENLKRTRGTARNLSPVKVVDLKKLQSTDVAIEAKCEKSTSLATTNKDRSSKAFDKCTETDQSILFLKSLVPYFQQMDAVQQIRVRNKFQDIIISEIIKPKEKP